MKKTSYIIRTNKGIKKIYGMCEKHGSIIIHRPFDSDKKIWIITGCGYKITTAKKINQAREIAKFLMQYSYLDVNAINYYKYHQDYIKDVLSTLK